MAIQPRRSSLDRRRDFDYRKAIAVGVGVGLFVSILGFIVVGGLSAVFTEPAKGVPNENNRAAQLCSAAAAAREASAGNRVDGAAASLPDGCDIFLRAH